MFKPKYNLSPKLLSNIAKIERLYGQIEAIKIPSKLELNLIRENLIESSYASNKIEGNPITLPEVTNLILDDRIPVNRDEKEIINYFNLVKELDKYLNIEFSIDLILKLHKLLMQGLDKSAGTIRNVKVVVGRSLKQEKGLSLRIKHDPPFHKRDKIVSGLEKLFNWLNTNKDIPVVIKSGIFHHQFVYLHPFEDGNGRVGRLLTALYFLKNDYFINKYFVLDDYYDIDRHQYSDMLHSADKGDKTEWLEYYSDGVMHSLKSALAKIQRAIRTLNIEERPSPKEQEVIKIIDENRQVTSQIIAKELRVSRQQAHKLLRSLLNKGLVEKKGSTKSSYYFLK